MKVKTALCPLIALLIIFTLPSQAALSVVDISAIKVSLANARSALAEQILHGQRQIEHIQKLVHQIEQVDRYLERFGDPKSVKLATFNEALGFLNRLELNKDSDEIVRGLDGAEIFRDASTSPYERLSSEIMLEGQAVAKHDTKVFAPEVAARRSLDHYREVRAAALEGRQRIKAEIESALHQLRSASTMSEVTKLNILIRALETQLAANDREIRFAADEVITRYFHNQVEERVQAKARIQRERAALRVSTGKDLGFYRLPSEPLYFNR